jgi:hypothetical protein
MIVESNEPDKGYEFSERVIAMGVDRLSEFKL